jgi:transposase
MIRLSRRRRLRSSGFTWSRRSAQPFFALMRRRLFRRSTASTRFCRYLRGRAEKHGFEYYRHGTLSLYAALDVTTGKVHGKTASRHTSADFIDFLTEIVERNRQPKQIHIVLDNLSAHKTQAVKEFLDQNPRVRFHFTPTYSSWLNQVEIWFAKIERDVIARGVFTSVADLSRKLMKYIRLYAKSARPFRWKYTDVRRRIVTI